LFPFIIFLSIVYAQEFVSSVPGETKPQYERRISWWREGRFGIFIHWGPVSIMGTEIGWSRGAQIPVEVYDNLYKKFNPKKFNPGDWAKLFKQAGAKYVVIVSKHHDGFSMFDSALTDYDCMSTPARRDFIGELTKACRSQGLRVMFYYSLCDWYHPQYLPKPSYVQDSPGHHRDFNKYLEFMFGQIKELCEKYHPDGIWFDGGWEHTPEEWHSSELFMAIHRILPKAILNNRAGLPGDYDTPEQEIGTFNTNRAWESCITIGTQWAWKPADRIKSFEECLRILVSCAGGDGNLLLNIGPTPEGEIVERQAKILKEIGAWLKRYRESIYGTRGGPFLPGHWGASTHKGNLIYLHIFNWENGGLKFPPIERRIIKGILLSGGKVNITQNRDGITINVPEKYRSSPVTVVKLFLDGPAKDIAPRNGPKLPTISAKASNVFQNMPAFGADKAVDEQSSTRWATDFGVHSAWLEVDLGNSKKVNGVRIEEAIEFGERIRRFSIEYKVNENEEWKTIIMGTKVGAKYIRYFIPIRARYWRLNILESSEGPTIYEFKLLSPKSR
ncbi:alpha-L-fucosidase, partial [bacterium]|nr:alpha-L-fucosidase [bacterium]